MGLYVKWINATRTQLKRVLERCTHRECAEKRFFGQNSKDMIKLKTSPLGWKYHLYDNLGSMRVERYYVGACFSDDLDLNPLSLRSSGSSSGTVYMIKLV